ncbi:MAG: HAMP domain-containing protein [Spirochaetia bacterium]|nr:HAMP domain-containing protein [Spirochaetia bacterium]
MSIRTKIILIFSIITAVIVGVSSGISYTLIKNSLKGELKGRILDIAKLGATSINIPAYKRLYEQVSPDLSESEIKEIEQSDDYKLISNQLNLIRNVEKGIIRYAYIMIPDKNPKISRFVVDADALSLIAEAKEKGKATEEISHFAQEFDISANEMRYLKKAIAEKKPIVEDELTYDQEYNISAISAYAPLYDKDGKTFLGIIGVDMSDKNIKNALEKSTLLSLIVILVSIIIAFVASFFSGTVITSGIIELTRVTKDFASKKFESRARVLTKDEVGQLGSSFNVMAQTIQDYARHLEQLLTAYNHFVPHTFLKLLGKESIIDVKLGDQVQEEMSILFSDIRSFTVLSESMTPRENFNFINAYLRRVGPVIRNNNGIIDKYIGDAVMALFPIQADDAVLSGIQMQRRVREYNEERAKAGYKPLAIGIGIHTGKLMLGTVGESERMNGTVISDSVNLASRLEGATKVYKAGIVISEDTLNNLKDSANYSVRLLDKIRVKGKKEPVSIYEVFDGDEEDVIEWKIKTRDKLNEAIHLYLLKNFDKSLVILNELFALNNNDELVKIYIQRSNYFIANGVPLDWDGVMTMTSK